MTDFKTRVVLLLVVFAAGVFIGARVDHNIATTGHAFTVCGDSR